MVDDVLAMRPDAHPPSGEEVNTRDLPYETRGSSRTQPEATSLCRALRFTAMEIAADDDDAVARSAEGYVALPFLSEAAARCSKDGSLAH